MPRTRTILQMLSASKATAPRPRTSTTSAVASYSSQCQLFNSMIPISSISRPGSYDYWSWSSASGRDRRMVNGGSIMRSFVVAPIKLSGPKRVQICRKSTLNVYISNDLAQMGLAGWHRSVVPIPPIRAQRTGTAFAQMTFRGARAARA